MISKLTKYSKRQWSILLVYSVVTTLSSFSNSLQGPFFPMVAESKGATPSLYGMVFGAFSLTILLASPISGIIINRFGVVKISLFAVLVQGVISIAFGFVDKLNGVPLFISVSFLLRLVQGFAYCMVRNSGIAVVSWEFSENVEIAFAIVNTFFSTGLLMGPVIGGVLYELGGFYLPFTVIGVLLLASAFVVIFLPKDYPTFEAKSNRQILIMLRQPSIILGIFIIVGCSLNSSLINSILQPHIKSLELSPVQVGLIFLCNGLTNIFSSFFWGVICEKYDVSLSISSISALVVACGLIVLGPSPYLPFNLNLYSCVFGILIQGMGTGGERIGGFSTINKGVLQAGLPQNIQASGFVSTIFTASVGLGAFVGPLIGGVTLEFFGFPWGSHIFILYHLLVCFVIAIYVYLRSGTLKIDAKTRNIESKEMIGIRYSGTDWN